MLETIVQTSPPQNFFDLLTANPTGTIAVIVLWAVAFMYGWWAISGRESIPRKLLALTFAIIVVAAFVLTMYLNPDVYDLASENIVQFLIAFIGTGLFSIIFLPTILLMALGALSGRFGR